MDKEKIITSITNRIKSEYKKYHNSDSIDWAEMASHKIYGNLFNNNQEQLNEKRYYHLRFIGLYGLIDGQENPKGHPQEIMKRLGITYQHATPQSVYDQWWFWNCENLPETLPPYLEIADLNPMECIGLGLTEEDAISIRDYELNNFLNNKI